MEGAIRCPVVPRNYSNYYTLCRVYDYEYNNLVIHGKCIADVVRSGVVHIASFHLPYSHTSYTATLFTRRNPFVNNRIRASSQHNHHVDKNPKSSYHPFEEITDPQICGDATLTPAETSRTIIQVSSYYSIK